MIEGLPPYVSPMFIATTFLTVGFLFYAIKRASAETFPGRSVLFLTAFWMLFTAAIAIGGFYQVTGVFPPRIFVFGALPAIIVGLALVIFVPGFINSLPLTVLTLLHVIRVPIELVLYWLAHSGTIPAAMTFEGNNFDILSGTTAAIVYFLAFRGVKPNRWLLLTWNAVALLLLVNIVTIAILAFPSPMQQIAFDQPNRAVSYFPFIWLPAIVVPIVFFAHIAAFRKLLSKSGGSEFRL
jgi:hypothetical protein